MSFLKIKNIFFVLMMLLINQAAIGQTQLIMSNEGGCFDETVRVKLTAKDFNQVTRMTASFTWSISIIEFEAACITNLPGLNIGSFEYSGINDGLLTLEWNDPTGNGITWPDDQPLLELCFKVRGNEGLETPANLVNNPIETAIFTIDSPNDPISISRTQGSVTVTDCGPDSLKFVLSNEVTTHLDPSACVKVSAEGFQNIQSFQYSASWNPNDLEFVSVENINLPGFTFSNLDISIIDNGLLPMAWESPLREGITIADGETLFEICYDSEQTPINVSNVGIFGVPLPIEATDRFNRPMIVEVDPGSVRTEFQAVNLTLTDTIIDPEMLFCIQAKPEFFFGIREFELGLEWNPAVLQYESANGFFLPDFSENNFDTDNVNSGLLNVFWQDPSNFGAFVPNEELLFEICFTAIGDPGESTTFQSNFSSMAISGLAGFQNVGIDLNGGTVTINDFFAQPISITNTTCLTKDLGAIDVNIIGGTQPIRVLWSNNETTEDLSGLREGNYTVILTDNSIPPRVYTRTFEIELDDPDAPDAIITAGSVVDCLNSPLQLDGSGSSQGDFTYLWESTDGSILNGEQTLEPTVQGVGTYILNVTDATTGCCSRTEIALENAIPPIADAGQSFDLNCFNRERNLVATNSSSGDNIRFVWTTTDGNIIRNADTPFPLIDRAGAYDLTVIDTITSCQTASSVIIGEDFEPPVAEAGTIRVITCDTLEQSLNAVGTSIGAEFSYDWTTDDGFFVEGESTLNPRVNAPGLYFINVLNERNGCESRDSIRVFGGSDLPFNDPGPDRVLTCDEPEILLNMATVPTGPNFEHYWYTDEGNIVTAWNTLSPLIDAPGTYALEVYNRETNCRNISSLTVFGDFDTPLLVPEETQIEYPCAGGTVSLLVEDRSGFPTEYTWTTDNGIFVGATNSNNTIVGGPGTYTLTARNMLNGCNSEVFVIVSIPLQPNTDITTNSILNCENQEVELTGEILNNVNSPNIEWLTLDGNITGATDELVTQANEPGTYLFVVTTASGCSDTSRFELIADMDAPLVSLSDSAALTCLIDEVQLDGTGSSSGADFSANWTTNNGNIVNTNNLAATVNQSGLYFLTITNELNGCDAIDSILVIADTIGPTIVLNSLDTIGCTGTIELDASGSAVGNYRWSDSQGGNIVSGENTPNPTIDAPGIYTLTLTDETSGCQSTAQIEVVFEANLPLANAGIDFSVCENGGQLDANLPDNVTGEWRLLTNGTEVEDVTLPNTEIINLLSGVNTFVWQLSMDECINYSSDTVRVTFADTPIAADDIVTIAPGQTSTGFNILNNDEVPADPSQFTFEIQNIPQIGNLVDLGDGQFRFDYSGEDPINLDFQYLLCSTACPDLCSRATVNISFEGIEILSDVPNVITPNGDGLNDELFFEEIGNGSFPDAEILIFNRYGDEVFSAQPYRNDWRGQNNSNRDLPHGTYYFILKLDGGGQNILKGNVTIMN